MDYDQKSSMYLQDPIPMFGSIQNSYREDLDLNLENHFLFCDLRDEEENVINMDRMAFSGDFLTQSHVPFATLAEGYDENKDIIRLYAYKNERFFPIESIRDFFAKYSYILPSPMVVSPVKIPELLVTVERKLKSVDKPTIIMTSWNQAIYKAVRLNHESDFIAALQLFNESINPDKMGCNYIDISDNSDEEGCNLGEKYFLHHVKSLPLKDSVSALNLQAFCLITVFEAQNVNVELVFHTEVNCRDIKILKCRTSDKVMKIKDRYLKFFGEKFHSKEQQSHMYLLQDGVRVPSDFCIHTYCKRPNAASTITFDVDICEEDPIEILVKIKRSTKALLIHDNMTVLSIKHKIYTYFGIPVETQRLSFNKRELSDQKYISCYALRERDVISLEQMKKVDVHFDFKKHKYDPLTIRLYRGMRVNDVKSELAKRYDMLECWIDLYHQGTKMVKATLYDNAVQHLSQIDVYIFENRLTIHIKPVSGKKIEVLFDNSEGKTVRELKEILCKEVKIKPSDQVLTASYTVLEDCNSLTDVIQKYGSLIFLNECDSKCGLGNFIPEDMRPIFLSNLKENEIEIRIGKVSGGLMVFSPCKFDKEKQCIRTSTINDGPILSATSSMFVHIAESLKGNTESETSRLFKGTPKEIATSDISIKKRTSDISSRRNTKSEGMVEPLDLLKEANRLRSVSCPNTSLKSSELPSIASLPDISSLRDKHYFQTSTSKTAIKFKASYEVTYVDKETGKTRRRTDNISASDSEVESLFNSSGLSSPVNEDLKLDKVAENVGRKWRQLGRKLRVTDVALDDIDQRRDSLYEKCMSMLTDWQQKQGHDATREILKQALLDIGMKNIVDTFFTDGADYSAESSPVVFS